MALTRFDPPGQVALGPTWTLYITQHSETASTGGKTTVSLIERIAGEAQEREVDTVNLGSREEREGLVARYCLTYPAFEPAYVDARLKHAYAITEGLMITQARRNGTRGATVFHDVFNAEALLERFGAHFRYCPTWKSWLYWTGTHWQRDHGEHIMDAARRTIRALGHAALEENDTELVKWCASSLNLRRLKNMVEAASTLPGVTCEPDIFDTHPWYLNCPNGTINLQNGQIISHDPTHLLTKCLDVMYDPEALCPEWEKFLWRVMGGPQRGAQDADDRLAAWEARATTEASATRLIAFLQRALGYACTGDTGEECLFLLHGSGRNGKSKFLTTIKALLGPYAKTADMHTFLHKDRDTVRNDLADLAGTRFVCASETSEHTRLADGLIKQLTGNDAIKARFLFEEYFEFPPTFKLFLAFNHRPTPGSGNDKAFWARIHEIPFTVFIPPEERDKHLGDKLCAELPGILAWMVRGCLDWGARQKLEPPIEVETATKAYQAESDLVQHFLDECCFVKPGDEAVSTRAGTLFEAYRAWCKSNGHHAPGSRTAFGQALSEKGIYAKVGHANKSFRCGVGLQARVQEIDEE